MSPRPRVLLVSPDAQADDLMKSNPYLPNGLLYLASALEADGCCVRVHDRNVSAADELARDLSAFAPDVAGVSVLTGRCITDAIAVSRRIRELAPRIPVVWGGVHPTLLPEQTLAEPYIDAVVRGDGEHTMRELVRGLAAGRGCGGIAGVSWREPSGAVRHNPDRPPITDLESLPDPAWHLVRMDRYPITSLNTSRGCPFKCTFCYNQGFNRGRRAELSAARVVRQITHLASAYGVRHFKFFEDNFTMNQRRVREFCALLPKAVPGVTWECEARAGTLGQDILHEMAAAGCRYIGVGMESGSPRMLEFLKKGITIGQIEETCARCTRAGIGTYLYVIGGLPTETEEEFRMTLSLLKRIPCYHHYELMIYRPYPGTVLYDYCVEKGLFAPPKTLAEWAQWSDLHSAERSLGGVPREVLARALLRNQRDNLISVVRFQMKTDPGAFLGKALNPVRLGRFAKNLAARTLRLHARKGV